MTATRIGPVVKSGPKSPSAKRDHMRPLFEQICIRSFRASPLARPGILRPAVVYGSTRSLRSRILMNGCYVDKPWPAQTEGAPSAGDEERRPAGLDVGRRSLDNARSSVIP